jgi:hypothetical protein
MRDSFPRGLPGAGSQGDPRLDALLTEEVTELLLEGWPRHAALSPELRQLRETVDALRAVPSRSELRAESLVMAAFRDISCASLDDTIVDGTAVGGTAVGGTAVGGAGPSDGMAHTLRLEIPHGPAAHRPRRAKHRAKPGGRPAGHPAGVSRPVVRRRRVLGTAAALALVLIVGIFAYAGSLPGPIQDAAHVAFGAPPVKTTSAPAPSVEVTGSKRAPASPMTGAREIRPSATSAAGPPASASPAGPRQWCQAYFSNPWKPGSTSWDKSDFEKLSKVTPGGSGWVLWYCSKYLAAGHDHDGMTFSFPTGFPGGNWAWTPDRGPGGAGGHSGDDLPAGSTQGPGTAGDLGPADVSGPDGGAGHGEATSALAIGGR